MVHLAKTRKLVNSISNVVSMRVHAEDGTEGIFMPGMNGIVRRRPPREATVESSSLYMDTSAGRYAVARVKW